MTWNDFLKPVKSLPARSEQRRWEGAQWHAAPVIVEGAGVAVTQAKSDTLSEKLARTFGPA